MYDKVKIGKRLRNQRECLLHTRETFAEQVGISPQFLAELENGSKGMSAETLHKICLSFNISADYLLLGKDSKSTTDTPISLMLNQMLPDYSLVIEDLLKSLLMAIDISKSTQ